ncbi:methyl-accepting chemotaxis protein [uncultured Croceicoccus sp.]|uniref:methyl-accepting chemotaxis protein n=1 Tax=uncultured Croceicoccus sp. TaxID=1295329 RepID=UPI00261713EF|nr:methyl-accepting chemotaxis protein [uncultured Croceicoccus sp.]
MTIRRKLTACLAGLILIIVAMATLSLSTMASTTAAFETIVTDRVAAVGDLKVVADKYAVDIVDATHKARSGSLTYAEASRQIASGRAEIGERWTNYRSTRLTETEADMVEQTQAHMTAADARLDTLQSILQRGDADALRQFAREDLYPAIDPVSEDISALVELQIDVAESTGAQEIDHAYFLRNLMIALVVVAGAIGLAAIATVRTQVVGPIQRLALTIRGLAASKGEAEVPHLDQRDEIGDIARAVDNFREAVVDAEREKARAAADATEVLAEHLSSLAAGDLTCTIDRELPEAYAQIRHDFNAAVTELAATIGSVSDSVSEFRVGAGEVSQASDDLAQRTERQAASLEETSAALRQLTETVRKTAEDAEKASTAVADAKDDAGRGGTVVTRTVAAMERLETTSVEISDIISVIDGIAFQTNLLALNAGVEAARAGDAGRGFAVVASEVRALAQRSAEAAQDVKSRINATAGQVQESVTLVGETGQSLKRIIDRVAQISTLIEDIAGAANMQSDGLSQISGAVTEMDGVTQQNAAMVEQATAAARQLTSEASSLADEIGKFKMERTPRRAHALTPGTMRFAA